MRLRDRQPEASGPRLLSRRPRWSFGAAAVFCVCVASSGCSATPEASLGASQQAITYGTADTGDPAVVALAQLDPCAPAPTVYCTGTLIAPRVVVTAAHCVNLPTELLQVFFGSDAGEGGTWLRAVDRDAHPDFDGSTYLNDIGVVVLEADAPADPVPLQLDALDDSVIGATARIVGFGVPEPGGGEVGVKRTGTSEVSALEATRFETLPAPSMSCQVDSGGPVFLTLGGAEVLAGLTSSGDTLCLEYAHDTRVDAFAASYLQPIVDGVGGSAGAPPPLPSGGCGAVSPCVIVGCAEGEQCNADTGVCEAAPDTPASPPAPVFRARGGCQVVDGEPRSAGGWFALLALVACARRRVRAA